MNELQQVEFVMLKEFVRICNELGLKYYLVCGSALGAVKYGGFIPWDDDVDVALPRPDYDKFCKYAQKLLPHNLFLQYYKTDSFFPLVSAKIRDTSTTFIECGHQKIDIVHGVYIDVFPLDGFPNSERDQQVLSKQKNMCDRRRVVNLTYDRFSPQNWRAIRVNSYYLASKLCKKLRRTAGAIERFSEFSSSFDVSVSSLWCNHHEESNISQYIPQEWYGGGVQASFEGLDVRVPQEYDLYLQKRYGDWRADLPEDQKVGHHYHVVCDLKRPYTDYIEKLPNGRIQIRDIPQS